MARYASLYVRRAVITALKADAGVAALVRDRVYGQNPPAEPIFPFIRYGVPTSVPFKASGLDGSKIALTIHAFAKGSDDGVVDGLAGAIVAALDMAVLPLADAPFAAKVHNIAWTNTITLQDPAVKTGWHAIVQMTATVVS